MRMTFKYKTCSQPSLQLTAIPQSYCGLPLPRRLSSNCIEVIGDAKFALHFIWELLQKALLEVQMAFTEMVELFCLGKSWCVLEDIDQTCNYTPLCGNVCQVEVGAMCVCPYKLSPLDDTMTLATRTR